MFLTFIFRYIVKRLKINKFKRRDVSNTYQMVLHCILDPYKDSKLS